MALTSSSLACRHVAGHGPLPRLADDVVATTTSSGRRGCYNDAVRMSTRTSRLTRKVNHVPLGQIHLFPNGPWCAHHEPGGSCDRGAMIPRGVASRTHRGREEIQLPRAGVVPHEVEGPGAGGDALPVADPPGTVLAAGGGRRVQRVEGGGGHPQRWAKAELSGS